MTHKQIYRFTQSGVGQTIGRLWHRLAPSITCSRTVYRKKVYFNTRDHPFMLYTSRRALENAENLTNTILRVEGMFWDVGCNIGMYSLLSATYNKVVAFDLSPRNIELLEKSAKANHLSNRITCVSRPFTLKELNYMPPTNGRNCNTVQVTGPSSGSLISLSPDMAVMLYGIPSLIKMDIEGYETEFLADLEFREFIRYYNITLAVELHGQRAFELAQSFGKYKNLTPTNIVFMND